MKGISFFYFGPSFFSLELNFKNPLLISFDNALNQIFIRKKGKLILCLYIGASKMKSAFILHTRSLNICANSENEYYVYYVIMCPNIESISCSKFEFDHVEFSTFKMAKVGGFDFTIIIYIQHYFAINKQLICH